MIYGKTEDIYAQKAKKEQDQNTQENVLFREREDDHDIDGYGPK